MTKWEIIFGIATLIGMLIGFWQTIKLKKQEKDLEVYKYLFDAAEKNIEKEITIEELEFLKNEKQRMDEAITIELPKRAHLTVLSDRFKDDEKNVVTYYKRFIETKKEYEQLQEEVNTEIPESILDEIENQIMPQYLIKEERDTCMRSIIVLAYGASFFSFFDFSGFICRFLLVISTVPLFRLWYLTLPKDSEKRKEYLFKTGIGFSAVIGGCFIAITFIILFFEPYHVNDDGFILLPLVGFAFLFLAGVLYFFKVFKSHKINSRTEGKDNSDKQIEKYSHKK